MAPWRAVDQVGKGGLTLLTVEHMECDPANHLARRLQDDVHIIPLAMHLSLRWFVERLDDRSRTQTPSTR